MFDKVMPRTKGGKTYRNAELVESYREQGKLNHRQLLYFGRVYRDIERRLKIVFSRDFDSLLPSSTSLMLKNLIYRPCIAA